MNSTIVQLSDQITNLLCKQETSDIRLQQLQKGEQHFAVEQSWQPSPNNTAALRADDTEMKGSSADYVFNSQVLFVHDSNGHRVKGEILQFNTVVQKVLAYTILEAIGIFKRATFHSIPKKIILHLMTTNIVTR